MTTRWANPWTRHYQSVWMDRAGDPRLPPWLRVACLAYGSHAANGHALFKPGQVALVLGVVNPSTGEVFSADRHNVQRAIRLAMDYGWLVDGSGSRCLIVPGHAISGGRGEARAVCPQQHRHERAAKARREAAEREARRHHLRAVEGGSA